MKLADSHGVHVGCLLEDGSICSYVVGGIVSRKTLYVEKLDREVGLIIFLIDDILGNIREACLLLGGCCLGAGIVCTVAYICEHNALTYDILRLNNGACAFLDTEYLSICSRDYKCGTDSCPDTYRQTDDRYGRKETYDNCEYMLFTVVLINQCSLLPLL